MPQQSWTFPNTRQTMRSTYGPMAARVAANPYFKQGLEFVKSDFGFGEFGLIDPKQASLGMRVEASIHQQLTGQQLSKMGRAGAWTRAAGRSTVGSLKTGWKSGFMGKLGAVGKVAGPVFMAAAVYSGYKQGGVWGATKNAAVWASTSFVMGAGFKLAGAFLPNAMAVAGPIGIGVGIAAAAGYGTYKALEHGNATIKKYRKMELGSPIVDPFGIGGTMRQRSLQNLMMSPIGGRSAFGGEAALSHIPYMR